MTIEALPYDFSICQMTDARLGDLASPYFFARTDHEQSLVVRTSHVPAGTRKQDDGWKALRVEGTMDFSLIGILAKLSRILAEEEIGIFAVSTYDTDYILTKAADFPRALTALEREGIAVKRL